MNSYNDTEQAINNAVEAAKTVARSWGGDGRICIDITSGNKIWSAVAALATINSDGLFSYVQPSPDFELLLYDGEQLPE